MMGESRWHKLANQKKNPLSSSHHAFWWATFSTLIYSKKIRDILMNTSNKERLQALKLRAISFLVSWSLPQSNSHNKGGINLRTCRAVQVCTIVLYCSFGFLACATEILPSCVLMNNFFTFFYFEKIRDMLMNTSNKEWLHALTLRAISFLVLWSLPQSNSHNKGNIKLRTCRALQVCTTVLYSSFEELIYIYYKSYTP